MQIDSMASRYKGQSVATCKAHTLADSQQGVVLGGNITSTIHIKLPSHFIFISVIMFVTDKPYKCWTNLTRDIFRNSEP
jgi:hypothetical protein